ncbi:IMPACT family protein [Croceiramulus getboli]|nr:YigZ family protein [Flavobacteriaceae bacterium YJPT1-3]
MSTEETDAYKTLAKASPEVLFKDRGSKFMGLAFPVRTETEISTYLDRVRQDHPKATHHCYAWQLGVQNVQYRANDDGEPSNSAGMPIYGQIQSFEVTNILVVVVRYYGGTKLGVGGLINAYRTTAQMTLEAGKIIVRYLECELELTFEYPLLNTVMRVIKEEELDIAEQQMELNCRIRIRFRESELQRIQGRFKAIYGVKVKES